MCRASPHIPTAATRSSTSRGPSGGCGTFRTARARTSWSTQARIVLKSGLLPPPVVLGKSQCICRDAFRPRQTSSESAGTLGILHGIIGVAEVGRRTKEHLAPRSLLQIGRASCRERQDE